MLASALRRAARPPMAQYVNWFSRGFLNRTSWLLVGPTVHLYAYTRSLTLLSFGLYLSVNILRCIRRQDLDFLTKSARSDQARFIVLDTASNPLVTAEGTGDVHDVVKSKLEGEDSSTVCAL